MELSEDEIEVLGNNEVSAEYSHGWVKDGLFLATAKYTKDRKHDDSCISFDAGDGIEYGIVQRILTNAQGSVLILVRSLSLNVAQETTASDGIGNILNFIKCGAVTNFFQLISPINVIDKKICVVQESGDEEDIQNIYRFITLSFLEIQ